MRAASDLVIGFADTFLLMGMSSTRFIGCPLWTPTNVPNEVTVVSSAIGGKIGILAIECLKALTSKFSCRTISAVLDETPVWNQDVPGIGQWPIALS
jgi:hypothetical protein|tara:strand:+ start:297 stop:587 length:291 start_codon:yes stop_codon:yes gene_type:complete